MYYETRIVFGRRISLGFKLLISTELDACVRRKGSERGPISEANRTTKESYPRQLPETSALIKFFANQ